MSLGERLRALLGASGFADADALAPRGYPPGSRAPGRCLGLLRPASTEELSATLAACHAARQPLVTQGGLTGLVDGAVPLDGEYLLSLERMARIEAVDATGRTLVAQAGATIQSVQAAAAGHGLRLAVDWGARGSATVGGAIATNAGGHAVLRNGMMREQVLGLEAVLADGTVISSMHALLKNNAGYDLKQLFIGSEGTLGVVTRAVLRLRPAPAAHHAALLALPDFEAVVALLNALDAGLGGMLSGFEVMWQDHYELLTGPGGHAPPLPHGHPYYVLAEAAGPDPRADADRFEALLGGQLAAGRVLDAVVAASGPQRAAFWAVREDIAPLFRLLDPLLVYDVSLASRHVEAFVADMTRAVRAEWPGARRVVFGHLGDNNLHFCWCVGDGSQATRARLAGIVYGLLQPIGGSVSAEHGIGLQKKAWLGHTRTAAEIALMRSLKQWLDPHAILNPGRVA